MIPPDVEPSSRTFIYGVKASLAWLGMDRDGVDGGQNGQYVQSGYVARISDGVFQLTKKGTAGISKLQPNTRHEIRPSRLAETFWRSDAEIRFGAERAEHGRRAISRAKDFARPRQCGLERRLLAGRKARRHRLG